METIFTNKRFIKVATVLFALLALFVFMLFVNQIKKSRYVGKSQIQNVISVSAEGEVLAIPDIAVITVSVEKDGKTSKEATDSMNDLISKTLDYLKSQNIEDKDIKSEYGGVNPKYDYSYNNCIVYPCPQRTPTIIGYTATQSVTIKVREADNANEIRSGLTKVGITNISGPTFSIDDEEALRDEARALAIENAREKAKVLASDLGVRLGKVVSFNENGMGGYPIMYSKSMDMAVESAAGAERAPELPKGENKITSNVTITYEIR